MARLTLVTRNDDGSAQADDYFMPDTGGYIRFESPGKSGTLGSQIVWPKSRQNPAYSTVSATPETFEAVLRRWAKRSGNDVIGIHKS